MDLKNNIAGWYFSAAEIQEAMFGKRMLNPSLDLSNPCNLNCPYCFVEEKSSTRKVRRSNELNIEETLVLIDTFSSCGAKAITIVGAGEPTIDPHFKQVVEAISARGITTVLFTNGIALAHDPNIVHFLNKHGASVVLKYNAISPAIQDAVAGRLGYTAKRDMALEFLLDEGFAAHEPTRLGLDIMVFKGNINEIPKIHLYCRRNNLYPIAGDYIPTGRTEAGTFHGQAAFVWDNSDKKMHLENILAPPSPEERVHLFNELSQIDEKFGIKRNIHSAYYGGGICTQILGLYVDISGNIWPCVARKSRTNTGYLEKPLGNIRSGSSVSEIWLNDPSLEELRQTFNGGCPYKPTLPYPDHNKPSVVNS